jgi:hypothetical protein
VRTTVDIEDDVLQAARAIAARDRISIGRVISTLAREALSRPLTITTVGRLPVFEISADAVAITSEMVRVGMNDD